MIPNTIVEKDDSGLIMVLNALDGLLEEKFIEGIRSKHRTLYEIEQTHEMIKIYQHRVNIEAKAVTRFSESFIRSYATQNNKCFDTAQVLFGKIQSTIKCLKEVFHKTTSIDRRHLPDGVDAPSVFEKSILSHGEYTPDAFGMSSFSQSVNELYKSLDTLFSTSASILLLCRLMIEEEARMREDPVQLRQIFKESCDELLDSVKSAAAFITDTQDFPENELEKLRKKAGKNVDKFLKEGYHTVDKKVMIQYLIIQAIRNARNEGLTDTEAFFWRKNPKKALMVRKVIENFDSIPMVEGQKGHLSSNVLVEFLKWCGVQGSLETILYKDYFVPNYIVHNKLKPLGWNTVSGRRKELKETWGLNVL